jgi:RsiW-degrading membrane proteinase PrsW (M82 family)
LSESGKQQNLPVRTLHEFLVEISNEWNKFRMGSLLSIVSTVILLVLFAPRFVVLTLRRGGPLDTFIILGVVVALLCNIYLSYRQHQFYQKWEKRMGLMLHIEAELLGDEA